MTITDDIAYPFSLDEEIAVAEQELATAVRDARRCEADFDCYGVAETPRLAALAERLADLEREHAAGP